MAQLSRKYGKTPEQLFFRFVQALGVVPLTGSSNREHLEQDLATLSFDMEEQDLQLLQTMLHH